MDTAARCVLLLWLQFLTAVKCQECTLDQFVNSPNFDNNFDVSGLDATYGGGRKVRVPCMVGYTGFYRIICTEGKWEPVGSKCQLKSCGHPGDAQFADFQLEVGEDFVFGSQVTYKCNSGYQMVSRTNRRRCLTDGWDGNIPVCEGIKCPEVHVDNNVQVLGDAEESNSGNVIRFSCKSNDEMLEGSQEIHCKDDGEWSGTAPKCKAVRCTVPHIEHGSVTKGSQEYKEHEVLNFRCDASYKRADERLPRCTKYAGKADWSPTPACKPITCELTLPPLIGTTYSPLNKNMFSSGEILRVTCGDEYFILNTQTTELNIRCEENGDWDTNPVCQEVTCTGYINEERMYRPVNVWGGKRLGDTVRYDCASGYQPAGENSRATCTRNGWGPKPLCRGSTCAKPEIENSRFTNDEKQTYRNNDRLTYQCSGGNQESFTINCKNGVWQEIQRCPGKRHCEKPEIRHGFAVGPFEGTVYYSCDENYKLPIKTWWGQAECKDGVWVQLKPCIANTACGETPEISNGRVKTVYGDHQIECNDGYRPGYPKLTCQNGEWDFNVFTAKTICRANAKHCGPPPKVENAIVTGSYKREYLADSTVTYKCRENYMLEEDDTIACKAGKWETKNIQCVPYCEQLSDSRLTVKLAMVKQRYMEGDIVHYVCTAPADSEGYATCENGKWTTSEECPGIPCELKELSPSLKMFGSPTANTVKPGDKRGFFCEDGYDMEGPEEVLCLNTGTWDKQFPSCSEKCKIPALPQTVRITSSTQGIDFSKGDRLVFACRQYTHFMQGSPESTCLGNGVWSHPPPECGGPIGCSAPPTLANGDTKSIISSDAEFRNGDKVEYICQNKYIMDGGPFKTCENGEWKGNMRCLEPCTINKQIMDTRNIQFQYGSNNKLYATHKDFITFACKWLKIQVGSGPMRVQCNDGVMNLPICQ